jgi:hypothetical protein
MSLPPHQVLTDTPSPRQSSFAVMQPCARNWEKRLAQSPRRPAGIRKWLFQSNNPVRNKSSSAKTQRRPTTQERRPRNDFQERAVEACGGSGADESWNCVRRHWTPLAGPRSPRNLQTTRRDDSTKFTSSRISTWLRGCAAFGTFAVLPDFSCCSCIYCWRMALRCCKSRASTTLRPSSATARSSCI